jgi:hypothetical protein
MSYTKVVHDILFGSCILKSVVFPVSPVSPVHDILFGSCILKSVVLHVSPVSPVHDILFGSCILKSVVLPVSPVSPVPQGGLLTSIYSCQTIYHAPVTQVTHG